MLPTGLTYSSLANRWMPFMANGTCGVGRSRLPSSSKRAARGEGGPAVGRPTRSVSIPSRDSKGAHLRDTLPNCEMGVRVDVPLCRGMSSPSKLLADKAHLAETPPTPRAPHSRDGSGTDVQNTRAVGAGRHYACHAISSRTKQTVCITCCFAAAP